MSTIPRMFVAIVSLAIVLSGAGCGGGGGGYDSPDAAFAAMKTAGENEDWKGMCNTLTDESVDLFAGMMVMASTMMESMGGALAGMGGEEGKKEFEQAMSAVKSAMKKHGVKSDPAAMGAMMGGGDPSAAMKGLVAPIKDKPAFVSDIMGAMSSMKDGPGAPGVQIPEDAKLGDLKIEGETATGVMEAGGQKNPIAFKKTPGGWLIDLEPLLANAMKRPPPMPTPAAK